MAGPVWRFEVELEGTCDNCLKRRKGMYVEGRIEENALEPVRMVCSECIARDNTLVVSGQTAGHAPGPAYAHNSARRPA